MQVEDPYDLSEWFAHKITSAIDAGENIEDLDPELTMFPERYNNPTEE